MSIEDVRTRLTVTHFDYYVYLLLTYSIRNLFSLYQSIKYIK